jgi:hypothetical protein
VTGRALRVHTWSMERRTKALILLILAIAAVIAFGTGLTLCIDWGGASAPPHSYGQAAVAAPASR